MSAGHVLHVFVNGQFWGKHAYFVKHFFYEKKKSNFTYEKYLLVRNKNYNYIYGKNKTYFIHRYIPPPVFRQIQR